MSGDKRVGATPAGEPGRAPFFVIDDDSPGQVYGEPDKRAVPLGAVIETDDETPITPTTEVIAPPPPAPPRRGVGTYAVASLATLMVVYWVVSLGEWVQDQFHRHSTLGYALLPLMIAAFFFSMWWFWSEISAWRRLVIADRLRGDLSETGQSQVDRNRFLSTLRHLAATMKEPQSSSIGLFLKEANEKRGADELRIVLEHDVIYPMDDGALNAVYRAIYDGFFLGLVSPSPITDTAAFVIRATGMIRSVAMAYGHRPGKLGLYRLIRRILADIAILSGVMIVMGRASSVVGHVIRWGTRGVEVLAVAHGVPVPIAHGVAGIGGLVADATDAVAEEIADAVAAATRMAQLGLLAITVSRPITLSAARRAEMSSRLREMVLTLRRTGHQSRELVSAP